MGHPLWGLGELETDDAGKTALSLDLQEAGIFPDHIAECHTTQPLLSSQRAADLTPFTRLAEIGPAPLGTLGIGDGKEGACDLRDLIDAERFQKFTNEIITIARVLLGGLRDHV